MDCYCYSWRNGPFRARDCQQTASLTSTCSHTEVNDHPQSSFWFTTPELPVKFIGSQIFLRCWVGTGPMHWRNVAPPSWIEPPPQQPNEARACFPSVSLTICTDVIWSKRAHLKGYLVDGWSNSSKPTLTHSYNLILHMEPFFIEMYVWGNFVWGREKWNPSITVLSIIFLLKYQRRILEEYCIFHHHFFHVLLYFLPNSNRMVDGWSISSKFKLLFSYNLIFHIGSSLFKKYIWGNFVWSRENYNYHLEMLMILLTGII